MTMPDTPKRGTPEWEQLLKGVLAGNTADHKGWAAKLAEARNPAARKRIIREIEKRGKS